MCLGFLLGGGHIVSLCPACIKTPDFQKESRCSAQTTLFVQTIYIVITFISAGNPPKIQVPGSQPRANLVSRSPRVSGQALLTLWHKSFFLNIISQCCQLKCYFDRHNPRKLNKAQPNLKAKKHQFNNTKTDYCSYF